MFVAACTLVKEQYGKVRCRRGHRPGAVPTTTPQTQTPCLSCEVWKLARRASNVMTQSSVTTTTDIALDGPEAALPSLAVVRSSKNAKTVACDAATLQRRFHESRLLIAAIELGLFTVLADVSLTCSEILERLHSNESCLASSAAQIGDDFLNELVNLQLLHRHEDCSATTTTTAFVDTKAGACGTIHFSSAQSDQVNVAGPVAEATLSLSDQKVDSHFNSQHYYHNSAAANLYLVKTKGPTYLGDTLLVHYGRRRYQLWCRYQETLLLPEDARASSSSSSVLPTVRETKLYVRNKFKEMRHCDVSPRHVFNVAHGLIPYMVVSTARDLQLVDVLQSRERELTTTQIHQALHFQCRLERTVDFLDTLVQYQVLASVQRDGKVYYYAIDTTATATATADADAAANEGTGRTI